MMNIAAVAFTFLKISVLTKYHGTLSRYRCLLTERDCNWKPPVRLSRLQYTTKAGDLSAIEALVSVLSSQTSTTQCVVHAIGSVSLDIPLSFILSAPKQVMCSLPNHENPEVCSARTHSRALVKCDGRRILVATWCHLNAVTEK